jgi:hypothetical protein
MEKTLNGRRTIPGNLFRIGMFPDSHNSVHVLYLAIVLIGLFQRRWRTLSSTTLSNLSPHEKIFVSTSFRIAWRFREAAADANLYRYQACGPVGQVCWEGWDATKQHFWHATIRSAFHRMDVTIFLCIESTDSVWLWKTAWRRDTSLKRFSQRF